MVEMSFSQGFGEPELKKLHSAVRQEAIRQGLVPQQGFVLLFIVDELSGAVCAQARASRVELRVQADSAGFRLTLKDDGLPFTAVPPRDAGPSAPKDAVSGRGDLGFLARLVDGLKCAVTSEGLNVVEIVKAFRGPETASVTAASFVPPTPDIP